VPLLTRDANSLASRSYKINTDLVSTETTATLGEADAYSFPNTIFLSPTLFRSSTEHVITAWLPGADGTRFSSTLMNIMIHEDAHLRSYNPYVNSGFNRLWFGIDNVHGWIDQYVQQIIDIIQLRSRNPAKPPTGIDDGE
jgi:hypothetical protein